MSDTPTRITRVGTVVLPVDDQDAALDFFVNTLGFETRLDAEFAPGQRWIEVAPPAPTPRSHSWRVMVRTASRSASRPPTRRTITQRCDPRAWMPTLS